MKKIYKILISALLIGVLSAALAFNISAEETPLNIVKTGAAFNDGEINLTYTADSTIGENVKLFIWDTYPISGTVPIYETAEFSEMTLEGNSYKVFASNSILIQNLRKPYYAALSTVDGDGNIISRGEIVKHSVFSHYLDILSTGTADQLALFTKLLNIGAAMQKQLLGTALYTANDLTLAGGYSNEYYALTTSIYIDGVLADNETSYYSSPSEIRLTAQRVIDGASFVGFTDKSGTALKEYGELTSSTWNELPYSVNSVGTSYINLNYTSGMILSTDYENISSLTSHGVSKDSGTALIEPTRRAVTTDKKGVASTTAITGSAHVSISSKGEIGRAHV